MADPKAPIKEVKPEVKATVEAMPTPVAVQPLKVKLHEKLKSFSKEELEQVYVWYGSKDGCPFPNYGVGGVCFVAHCGQTKVGSHGGPDSVNTMDGNFHKMTLVRVEEVVAVVGKHIFRTTGGRVEQWDVTHPDYVQDSTDVPVSRHLYMVIVPEGAPFDRDARKAPSMV